MTRALQIAAEAPDPKAIGRAAEEVRRGRLVVYPTETFYGLGADPLNPDAVERVFAAKGRPEKMALPLIAGDVESARTCVREFPEPARRLAAAFWPGPLTLVLPAAPALPRRLLGGGHTVGLRVSSHPVAAVLARAAGGPIVATSANRTGSPPPALVVDLDAALLAEVALVLDAGPTRGGLTSTVLDLTSDPPRLIRSGAVPLADLERVLDRRIA